MYVCMYVCMYLYVYIYIYTALYIYIYICVYTLEYACMYVCMYIYIYTHAVYSLLYMRTNFLVCPIHHSCENSDYMCRAFEMNTTKNGIEDEDDGDD